MISYKYFVNRSGILYVRVMNARRKAEFSTGVRMSEDDLAALMGGRVTSANKYWSRLLAVWDTAMESVQVSLLSQGRSDEDVRVIADMMRERVLGCGKPEDEDGDGKVDFVVYMEKVSEVRGNRGYRDSCLYTLGKVREYVKVGVLPFEEVTVGWLRGFDSWLEGQGLSVNSRAIHMKNVRTAVNRAIDDELMTVYPFRRFRIRTEVTRKRSLSVEELRRLFSWDVEEWQREYLDIFKLMFMLCGINAVDLHGLKKVSKSGRVEYRRAKTKRLYSVKVEPEAMEIIGRHRGKNGLLDISDRWKDHRDFTKQINIALKKIGKVRIVGRGGKKEVTPEWPELSTYWSRHSWATIAASLDIPKETIAAALGHGGNTVTDVYIDFDQSKVDDANRRVIDWVLYGRR